MASLESVRPLTPDQGAWPPPSYAWYVCTILLIAFAFAILDRVAIGLLVDPIKHDLMLSDTEIGVLQGFAFAIFYSLFGLPMGFLVDLWKRPALLAIAMTVWTAAMMGSGVVRSFGGLFFARVAVGAGESALLPGATSLISDYFPPGSRSRAMGVFMLGGALGGGLASFFVALAIMAADSLRGLFPETVGRFQSWQLVFIILGLPGMFVAPLIWCTIKEPTRRERIPATKVSHNVLFQQLSAHKLAYCTIVGAAVIISAAVAAQFAWWPTLFMRVHQWSATKFGVVYAVVGLPCAILSPLSAGFLMTWLAKRGRRDGPILMMLGQATACAIFATAKCLAPSPTLAFASYVFVGLTGIWSLTGALTALSQITPNELRGQVVAILSLLTGLVSYALGSAVVGILTDHLFSGPTGIRWALALVYFACGVAASATLLLGRRSFMEAATRRAW